MKVNRKTEIMVLCIGILVFYPACSMYIEKKEVIGTYKFTYFDGKGTEYWNLQEDGSFVQVFIEKDGRTIHKNKGTWRYYNEKNGKYQTRVSINNIVNYVGECSEPSKIGEKWGGSFPLYSILGRIKIDVESDLGCIFEKVE